MSFSECAVSVTTESTIPIDETEIIDKKTSLIKTKAELVADFTTLERNVTHYIAITLWLGWMQFYPIVAVVLPVLYHHGYFRVMTCIVGVIVFSAVSPIESEMQPAQAFEFGNWVIKKSAAYLGLRVYYESLKDVDKEDKCIFVIEPHDVLPLGLCGFHRSLHCLKHNIVAGVSSACFAIPLMRHMYTWLRCGKVSKNALVGVLNSGDSVVLCPGGAQEVAYMENENDIILYIKSRLGIVKLALESGTPIVPSFCFGQRKAFSFWVPQLPEHAQKFCRKLGFLPVMFFGYFGMPLAPPKPANLALVVGAPILMPQLNNPTAEDLQKYHAVVVKEYERIFEEYKHLHGMEHCTLKIV